MEVEGRGSPEHGRREGGSKLRIGSKIEPNCRCRDSRAKKTDDGWPTFAILLHCTPF